MDYISKLDQTLVIKFQNLLFEVFLYVHKKKSTFEFVTSSKTSENNIVIDAD